MARPPKKAVVRRQPRLAAKQSRKQNSEQKPESAVAASVVLPAHGEAKRELVILTGLSGSGKASALKAFEDLGYYAVDNLPLELLPHFAALVAQSMEITRAALVVDVREGQRLERFPATLKDLRQQLDTTVVYLEASEPVLLRRFSETRRPHPLGREERVGEAIRAERKLLDPVRNVADILIDTSRFNVHELRAYVQNQFKRESDGKGLLISTLSFGYKNGIPLEADLVFDVRFLPNPHFVPEFRKLTGRHPKVIGYVGQFPQTREFLDKVTDLLLFLLPHYIHEGKSYLTVAFGCTGGQHRSVMIAEEMKKRLVREGYRVKAHHRDMPR
ncbi:RNase adapter RapZ [Silvibacterium dinghuense]|uniref:RNase adapter RapZ n=1 Tax=Silvibacterium dinghuense TaxID=1560006 RepID=A0A4Q1SE86_9BACT|nr:RNase adapter RapZ [Silvibacterium dinghuense]RXS95391.1 RNase adapter RapZ [Silvibacterium dinghuense]GGH12872.1 nucleotide-binding protein [Silvibacterium dinghuense]